MSNAKRKGQGFWIANAIVLVLAMSLLPFWPAPIPKWVKGLFSIWLLVDIVGTLWVTFGDERHQD